MRKYHERLLFLSEPLLAQENHGCLENKAHGMQFQTLLDLAQEVADVQPFHAPVVQQVARTHVNRLQIGNENSVEGDTTGGKAQCARSLILPTAQTF